MRTRTVILLISLILMLACGREGATTDTNAVEPAPSDTASADAIPPNDTSTNTDTAVTTNTGSPGASSAPYDAQFIDTMSTHHQMAITMARMQLEKGTDPKIKEMAQKTIDEQQKEIDQMQNWRNGWYANVPPAENRTLPGGSSMNIDMNHMNMPSGEAMDKMFVDMMIPHHQGAIAMSNDALTRAEHQEIKELARKIASDQQKEIAEMQAWRKAHP